MDANNNWWGSNTNPSNRVSSFVDLSKWLILTVTPSETTIPIEGNTTITADLTHNQTGVYYKPQLGYLPDGITVNFTGTLGTLNPTSANTINGIATSNFIADLPGTGTVQPLR